MRKTIQINIFIVVKQIKRLPNRLTSLYKKSSLWVNRSRFNAALFSSLYVLAALLYLFISTHTTLASGNWNQTDWSSGSGSSTTNQYASASGVDATTTSGQFSLNKSESLTNTGFETNLNSWSTSASQLTPALVQAQSVRGSAASSVSATFGVTPVSGNVLVAVLTNATASPTITPSSGWTQDLQQLGNGSFPTTIFHKVAGASEPTAISFGYTGGATVAHLDIMEYSGLDTTSLIDKTVSSSSGATSGTSFSPGTTAQTTYNSELAIAVVGFNTGVSNPSFNNSFVAPATPATWRQVVGYKVLSSQQTVTATASWTTSNTAQGAIVTFKAANGATATRDTATTHSASTGSAKLVTTAGGAGSFVQSVNVGDTNSYNLSGYVYTNGSAVTSSDVSLYYDSATVSTTFTSVGSGWYKLTATVTGAASAKNYGVQVASNKTIYLDDMSLNKYGTSGSLTSNIYDTGVGSNWGTLSYVTGGTGTTVVKARSSNSSSMAGATSFSSCAAITSGADISTATGGCVTDAQRYIQYEVTLSNSTTATTPTFQDITVVFTDADTTPPATNASALHMYKTNGGTEVSSGAWTNATTPYFSWTAGTDNVGGLGIKGYCLYLGTDNTADPVTTKGMLGTSPISTSGNCQFAVSGANVDLSTVGYLGTALSTSNSSYYLLVKAIDNADNVYTGSSASFAFKFDNTAPNNPAYISAPSNFISTKTATLSWSTSDGDAASDSNSGVAGLQYRIGAATSWYGDSHSGSQDATDLLTNDGSYTTQSSPDFANLTDGNNVIYFRTWDTAGNVTTATVTTALKINTAGAPSSPRNLTATPSTNTANSFGFSWLAPATYVGQASNITYCYTINTLPTAQTCTFTSAGTLSLSAGAYATQPGTNTVYVVAKDESGSINYATAASADFIANTSAPGMPLSPDVADTSVKASSSWRLAVSWEAPSDVGAGVSKYQVYRSSNGISYTLAGNTSGTSYVDTGLSQQLYYYKIRACDSANNCGAYSEVVSKTPTGRFTSASSLVGQPRVESVGTRKAKITWTTDRAGDSKVAYGTATNNYSATEAYNSSQTTSHTIELTNLSPGTTYFYKVKWTDEDGNTGQSSELTFATLPPPVVQDVTVPQVGLHNATVQFTTVGASAVKLYYGKSSSFGGTVSLNTSENQSTYNQTLPDLDDGTKYSFKLNTFDGEGNEYDGTVLTFTTPPAPKIINLRFQPVPEEPSSSQKVSWETNVAASSELSYGPNGLTESSVDGNLVTKHELIIRGLKDNSDYKLVARSRDGAGNLATSDQQVFKTALDTRPPVISDVVVDTTIRGTGAEARGQVVVSWRTDEPSTSQVGYGEGASGFLSSTSSEDTRLSYEHVIVVSDLSTSRVYHVEPRSYDNARNLGQGEQQVAIVGRGSDSVLSIIFNALQRIFGVD